MDARQQDPRAIAANGAAQASATGGAATSPGPAVSAGSSKNIGWAELISIALGLGGLYLLVRVRSEVLPEDDDTDDLGDNRAAHPDSNHAPDLAGWGHTFPHPENPPTWVADEPVWERAKQRVRAHWHEYREPWAVVAHVYEQMGGRTAEGG